jgi:hypothetical protein
MTLGSNWGATATEQAVAMPCDELLGERGAVRLHRAIDVHARPSTVFRWLCQLRAAPYSYDLVDNLGRRSPRELQAGLEQLELGQRFMFIFSLAAFQTDEHLTLLGGRTAVTYMVDSKPDGATRLLARVIFSPPGPPPLATVTGQLLALGDLVMMRKQLLTLKSLAEQPGDGSAQT